MERKIRIIGWLQFMWQMLYWENLIIKNSCLSRLILAKHDRYFDLPAKVAAPYGSSVSVVYEPRRPHLRGRRCPVCPSRTQGCHTHTLTPAVWVSAHTMQLSAAAAGCPAIPFHSDTDWSQGWRHRLRAQSYRTALNLRGQLCVPGCRWGFWPTCYKAQVSRLLSRGSVIY